MSVVGHPQRALVGEVAAVPRALRVLELRGRAEDRALGLVEEVEDEPPHHDAPFAVAPLEAVDVAPAAHRDGLLVLQAVHPLAVALGVRDVAVDLAVVGRDLVQVRVGVPMARAVRPRDERLAAADPGTVVVDRVLVEDAAQHVVVVAVQPAGVAVDHVLDLQAVQQVLQLLVHIRDGATAQPSTSYTSVAGRARATSAAASFTTSRRSSWAGVRCSTRARSMSSSGTEPARAASVTVRSR